MKTIKRCDGGEYQYLTSSVALATLGARTTVTRSSVLLGDFNGAGALRTSELRVIASIMPNTAL